VQGVLLALQGSASTADAVVEALRTDVNAFTAGAEPTDDVTILVLCWRGPHAAG
jgi:hypothetical protein